MRLDALRDRLREVADAAGYRSRPRSITVDAMPDLLMVALLEQEEAWTSDALSCGSSESGDGSSLPSAALSGAS